MFSALRLCVALLFVSVTLCELRGRERGSYPNPTTQQMSCGREPRSISYVCDPDNILTRDEANQLDVVIQSIRNETRCPCSTYSCQAHPEGYKVGVALMTKMEIDSFKIDSDNDDNDDDNNERKKKLLAMDEAKLFAHELHKTWKLGYCDEDIIIVYSYADAVVYTVTGSVARTKLDDRRVGDIALSARRKNFSKSIFSGLMNIVETYRAVLLNQAVSYEVPEYRPLKSLAAGRLSCVPLFVILSCVFIALFMPSE